MDLSQCRLLALAGLATSTLPLMARPLDRMVIGNREPARPGCDHYECHVSRRAA
jgi:hypothetical protein